MRSTLHREEGLWLLGPARRLERELALAPRLDPAWALIPVELGRLRGEPALRLEDPGGQTLEDLTGGLDVALAVTRALRGVHEAGLLHRDLHPGHVLLHESGVARLTGFAGTGTLEYLAPEQTGRLNRPVDSRSDLYSLGVVLYRLLTRKLPFEASDALEWVHCHLAREPRPPALPAPLSDLLLKLLDKRAERRYQSARGLEADLRRCQKRRRRFTLGKDDHPERLTVTGRLYGRETELERLREALGRVGEGRAEGLVLTGYAGVGKSALVEAFRQTVPPEVLFASGKHDQYRRDVPYAPLIEAFHELLRVLLSRPEAEVEEWRVALNRALAGQGGLLVPLVPELERLVGPQPALVELPPQRARGRFQALLLRFVQAFARPGRPLVLFVDDLQWLDAASLELLPELLGLSHLLVLGASRESAGPFPSWEIAPLKGELLTRLVADVLGCSQARARPLARLVAGKTGGNPFFAVQLLTALADEGQLTWADGWHWDPERISARDYSDNVVDLMVEKLRRLPRPVREELSRLACLGGSAEVDPQVLQTGLLRSTPEGWSFAHDRVQEAAYALLAPSERARLHYELGRRLRAGGDLFACVHQLNCAQELLDPDERRELAELNLEAARQARAATAYRTALNYLEVTRRLGEPSFALEYHTAECEFLTGQLEGARERLERLSLTPLSRAELGSVARLRMDLYTTLDQSDRALDVCLDFLRLFGIDWPRHPTDAQVDAERALLGECLPEELVDLPLLTDPGWKAVLEVLGQAFPAAMFTDRNLLALVLLRMATLSREHGNSPDSVLGYMHLVLVFGGRWGDYETSFRFAALALTLVERPGLDGQACRVYQGYGNFVLHWKEPVRRGRTWLRKAQELARAAGDLTFVAYLDFITLAQLLASGDPLEELQIEAERALAYARERKFGLVQAMVSVQLGLIRSLRGETERLGSFAHPEFDEEAFERRLLANPNLALPTCYWHIHRLQALCYAHRFEEAVQAAAAAERLLWTSPAFLRLSDFHFFAGLAKAALGRSPREHQQQLDSWSRHCPANFGHRATLLAAEVARLEGRGQAEELYERAAAGAQKEGFLQDEALAHEAAGRHYAGRQLETAAQAHRHRARACYERWGADGVVRRLPGPPGPSAGLEEVDLLAVIRMSQALSTELALEPLCEKLLRLVVEHAGAVRGLLISAPDLRLEAEAGPAGVTLPRRPVRSQDLPEDVLRLVLRTGQSVRREASLGLPLVRQGEVTGVLFLEHGPDALFTDRHLTILELVASQAAISLDNARLYDGMRRAEALARGQLEALNRTLDALAEDASSDRLEEHVVRAARDLLGAQDVRLSHQTAPKASVGPGELRVPMQVGGQLVVRWSDGRRVGAQELALGQALASQAALARELTRLSRASRQAAIESERTRLARDLHDTLAQGFTGVILQLEAAEDAASRGLVTEVDRHVTRASQMARQGLHEARRSVHALRPKALEGQDLAEALRALCDQMGAGFRVGGQPWALPAAWEEDLLRISQELIANALKHAQSQSLDLTLTFDSRELWLEARDDGCGFDPSAAHDGFGLTGIRERVEAMGGGLSVLSSPGHGTQVLVRLPSKG